MTSDEVLIEVDGRRRVSLGKLGRHARYLGREESDGTIVLTPAVVISEHDLRLQARPDLLERFEANRNDPGRLVRRRRSPGSQAGSSDPRAT